MHVVQSPRVRRKGPDAYRPTVRATGFYIDFRLPRTGLQSADALRLVNLLLNLKAVSRGKRPRNAEAKVAAKYAIGTFRGANACWVP